VKVGIIGSGRIGGNLGKQLARGGHEVMLSFSRDRRSLEALADDAPGARVGDPAEAVAFGDAVILSVPWTAIDTALSQAGPLNGKAVIDTTNQFGPQGLEALSNGTTAVESNARRMPGARLAKAFNTLTAGYQQAVAEGQVDGPVAMFFASEDDAAASMAEELVRTCRFEPVRIGGWREVALMEAPRRHGSVYGEAYRPADARRIADAAADDLDQAGALATELRIE
jgi:8-hydroxy-5-deazaflavin:NADPH oxidoreductase